jgi:hypothetical protein
VINGAVSSDALDVENPHISNFIKRNTESLRTALRKEDILLYNKDAKEAHLEDIIADILLNIGSVLNTLPQNYVIALQRFGEPELLLERYGIRVKKRSKGSSKIDKKVEGA